MKINVQIVSMFLLLATSFFMAFQWVQSPCERVQFSFGIIADCQYCACSNNGNAYYGNSIPKLQEAVDTFDARRVSHAVHLGDFIQQSFSSYDEVEPVYSSMDSAHYYALGNHEFTISEAEKPLILSRLGMPDYYYSFTKYKWRFIVLETTELAFYSEIVHPDKVAERDTLWQSISGNINAKTYNGGVSQEQLDWLDQTLTEASNLGQKAVVMSHHPVWPLTGACVWNNQDIIDILESHDNVVAYMNGHNHAGNYAEKNGIHYITFQGMLLTADQNSFSVVDVYPDKLEINGFGRQLNYTLPFTVNGVLAEPNIKVFLEGAFDETQGEMRADLNTVWKLLPGQMPSSTLITPTPPVSPYIGAPWNYNGTEVSMFTEMDYPATVVDWVLISLRTSAEAADEIVKVAGLLHKDGSVEIPNGCLRLSENSSYYIVVEHRNHLPVMSATAVDIVDGELSYDFSLQDSYHTATDLGSKEITPGTWGMYGGNVYPDYIDQGFQINGADKTTWLTGNGQFHIYTATDVNMDGDINGGDKSLWLKNNGIVSGVPKAF